MDSAEVFLKLPKNQPLEQLFPAADSFIATVKGEDIINKAALMSALALAFHFPGYFGENWDALEDCLASLPEELEPKYKFYILAISNYSKLLAASLGDKAIFEDVFAAAAAFIWNTYKKRLVLICLQDFYE